MKTSLRVARLTAFSALVYLLFIQVQPGHADPTVALPEFVNGSLCLVFPQSLPVASAKLAVTYGAKTYNAKLSALAQSNGIYTTTLSATALSSALEANTPIKVAVTSSTFNAVWEIDTVVNYITSPSLLPQSFNGGSDTNSTAQMTWTSTGAHTTINFTGQENNYVIFPVSGALPAGTVAVGGVLHPDNSSPMPALLSLRVLDSTGETYGISCHGHDAEYTTAFSSPLTRFQYQFGGPVGTAPVPPLSDEDIIFEPATWLWAGSMSTYISCLYAIREVSFASTLAPPALTAAVDQPVAGNKSMSGFLLGLDENGPPTSVITPLQPQLFRIGNGWLNCRDRLQSMGIPFTLNVGDIWGYDPSNAPSTNWPAWDSFVQQTVTSALPYSVVSYEVWNEPDATPSWTGFTPYLAVYQHAYADIRAAAGPDVAVEGPSLSIYNYATIQQFLNFCVANNLQCNYLSWHELTDTDNDIPAMAGRISQARTDFLNNPAYASVGLRGIHIEETVGPSAQYHPGEITGYLHYLEVGGADAACKGCWFDSNGSNNGFNDSLDGIVVPNYLTATAGEPRAPYWAYKIYADGASSRIGSSSANTRLSVIASSTSKSALILIGNYTVEDFNCTVPATLVVSGFADSVNFVGVKKVNVTLSRIPDTGEAPLSAPLLLSTTSAKVTNGKVTLQLPAIIPHEALEVQISAS